MRLWCLSILFSGFVIVVGCSNPAPPSVSDKEEGESSKPKESDAMTMQGIDLYMHKPVSGGQKSGKPELWVRAESLNIGDGNTYYFENARAVIYGQEESEEVVIEAKRGSFEQDARAVLEGDVVLDAGTLHMLLTDIQWTRPEDGGTGAAYSENPVVIDDPELQLKASNLRLYPDTQQFELDNVTGMVRFGGKLL